MLWCKPLGLLGDGDEESHAPSLLESLIDLGSHECMEESSQEAKRCGEARKECPVPLSDLGRRRAWPRGPGQVCREDFAAPGGLQGLPVELGWRRVDFVAAQVQGKAAFQISAPLLDPLAWLRVAELPDLGCGCNWRVAPPDPSLLMAFVLCVWAVHKATCPPTQAKSSYGRETLTSCGEVTKSPMDTKV